MSYNLFLDDDPARKPNALPWIELPLVEWTIVRSYDEFVAHVKKHGPPLRVSFDHDLHPSHYAEGQKHDFQYFDYKAVKVKTGYCAAKWLANYCRENKCDFPEFSVHTLNARGQNNIVKYIFNYRKVASGTMTEEFLDERVREFDRPTGYETPAQAA